MLVGLLLVVRTALGGVVINEFVPDPAGADGGYEWVELYNDGGAPVDLTDWTLQKGTTPTFSTEFTFPLGASIPAGGYVVVGEEFVVGATYVLATGDTIALGNASTGGDAVRLADAGGTPVDTVIYGPDNSDGFLDDNGLVATSVAPPPASGLSIARLPNGAVVLPGLDTDLDDAAWDSIGGTRAGDSRAGAPSPANGSCTIGGCRMPCGWPSSATPSP